MPATAALKLEDYIPAALWQPFTLSVPRIANPGAFSQELEELDEAVARYVESGARFRQSIEHTLTKVPGVVPLGSPELVDVLIATGEAYLVEHIRSVDRTNKLTAKFEERIRSDAGRKFLGANYRRAISVIARAKAAETDRIKVIERLISGLKVIRAAVDLDPGVGPIHGTATDLDEYEKRSRGR